MAWPSLRVAVVAALAALALNVVSAPFHGAAYFATPEGSTDLMDHQVAWGAWVRETMPWAFANGADAAYVAWGKATALVTVLLAVAMAGLHGAQDARLTGGARWTGRAAVVGWALFALFALFLYWVAIVDAVFMAMIPVLLATIVLTGVYGVQTARRAILPARAGWALLGGAVLFIPLIIAMGHIPFGLMGWGVAWAVAAPALWRRAASPAADAVVA